MCANQELKDQVSLGGPGWNSLVCPWQDLLTRELSAAVVACTRVQEIKPVSGLVWVGERLLSTHSCLTVDDCWGRGKYVFLSVWPLAGQPIPVDGLITVTVWAAQIRLNSRLFKTRECDVGGRDLELGGEEGVNMVKICFLYYEILKELIKIFLKC